MKNSGKLLRITDDRYIFIIENEDGSYITPELIIRYRNIGPNYEIAIINESQVNATKEGAIEVLDNVGNAKFHFPLVWLDTDKMKIMNLVEKGLLKFS